MIANDVKTTYDLRELYDEIRQEIYYENQNDRYYGTADGWAIRDRSRNEEKSEIYESIRYLAGEMANRPEEPWSEEETLSKLRAVLQMRRFSGEYEILETFVNDRSNNVQVLAAPSKRIQWLGQTTDFYRLVEYLERKGLIPPKQRARFSRSFLDKNGNQFLEDSSAFTAKATMMPDPETKAVIDDFAKNKNIG